jgi:hypothetical protein
MTVSNLRCDRCNALLAGLIDTTSPGRARGVRFSYHPGDPGMRDESGLLCGGCWSAWVDHLGVPSARICAVCGKPVTRTTSLHLRRVDTRDTWQLCTPHAAELLNTLTTVVPKLDPATFVLPLAHSDTRSVDA